MIPPASNRPEDTLVSLKPILFLTPTTCVLSGAMTPVSSFLLSYFLVGASAGAGASNVSVMNNSGDAI